MRNDLQVGDYVRTEDGFIAKIININEFREPSLKYGIEASYFKDIRFIGDEDIIKASDKLIDLIERNDIITLKNDNDVYKVLSVPDEKVGSDCFYLVFDYEKEFGVEDIRVTKEEMEENLCSIVTKEQFEQVKYKE